MQRIRYLMLGSSVILLLVILLFFAWDSLIALIRGYGKEFNADRLLLGQPIVEEYFIMTKEENSFRQTWITPDSLKSDKVHISKHFNTNNGKIVYEFDLFARESDGSRYLLLREYFFENDSIAYQYKLDMVDKPYDEISLEMGDSILNHWL